MPVITIYQRPVAKGLNSWGQDYFDALRNAIPELKLDDAITVRIDLFVNSDNYYRTIVLANPIIELIENRMVKRKVSVVHWHINRYEISSGHEHVDIKWELLR